MFDAVPNMPPCEDIVLEPLGDRRIEAVIRDQDGRPVVGAVSGSASTDANGFIRKENIDIAALRNLMVWHGDYSMFEYRWLRTNRRHELTTVKGTHDLSGHRDGSTTDRCANIDRFAPGKVLRVLPSIGEKDEQKKGLNCMTIETIPARIGRVPGPAPVNPAAESLQPIVFHWWS